MLEAWDTGIGIAEADQARILDEFTRAGKASLSPGVGLGLSVVERACRLLDHGLTVQSEPGRGSIFSIEMEVVTGAAAPEEPAELTDPAFDHPLDCIVLVVEKDQDVLYGTTQWPEQWGASVLPARTVQEALTHVADIGMPPDIILADYQLDDGDTGIQAITAIRDHTGTQVPAILVTADRSDALQRKSTAQDISVMHKPVKLSRPRPLIDRKVRWQVSARAGDASPGWRPTKVDDTARPDILTVAPGRLPT